MKYYINAISLAVSNSRCYVNTMSRTSQFPTMFLRSTNTASKGLTLNF